jgi:hypothetical protein
MLPCEFIEFPDQIMILLQLCEIIHRINVIIKKNSNNFNKMILYIVYKKIYINRIINQPPKSHMTHIR